MTYQERWFEDYRGIRTEVCCTHREPSPALDYTKAWTFYLYLAIEQFPTEIQPSLYAKSYFTDLGTPLTSYSDIPLNDLDWHCGMTWYSKEWNEDSVFKTIKVGCDYQHYWDEGYHEMYDAAFVTREAKKCVDSLWKQYPTLILMEDLWTQHRAKFPGEKK